NYLIAGLGFRDGHVLVHRAVHEPFWTVPGGRAEIGETSEETLKREMVEELGVEVTVHQIIEAEFVPIALFVVEEILDDPKQAMDG
ncbi:NUDIX domain-containing protein, partial [Rhizobium ruizarguesonis]